MLKFDQIYQNIVKQIMDDGVAEINKRTGVETKSLPGIHFSIDLEKDGFPILTLRKIPIKMFVAEQVWFISGARKPEIFLRDYTKIWDLFTNPGDVVTVAYGYRWRKHFNRDQLGLLIKMLEDDSSSRQGVVITWDPAQDGLSFGKKKNVPCPFTFVVNIIGGRLNLHNILRSNDVILGSPADVAGFALLQLILAKRLKVRPGIYSHSISNAHIYSNHYDGAREILKRENDHKKIEIDLPENSFELSEKMDKDFVDNLINNISNQYNPLASINGLKISL